MAQDKIILHWLQHSRSHRILWLFEELNVPYELKTYNRTKEYRAPSDFHKIHPLGKSPVVEIYPGGDESAEPILLAETGYIIQYFLENYDTDKKLVPTTKKNQELVKYYLHYTEGTLQANLVALLILSKAVEIAPRGSKWLVSYITGAIGKAYYIPETILNLDYLEKQLAKQPGGYFAGDKLSAADIILSFPLYHNLFANLDRAKKTVGLDADFTKKYPQIYKWTQKIKQDPGLVKADSVIAGLGESK